MVMEKRLQPRHDLRDLILGRRDKKGVAGSCSSNPVLGTAKLPGLLVFSATSGQKDFVHFTNQPVREGKVLLEAFQTVVQRSHIDAY
jgi:hypothetical protein